MSSSRADSHTESTESKNSEKTSLLAIDMSTSPLIGSLSDNVEDRRQLEDCSDTANDPLTQGSSVDRSTLETRLTTTPAGHAPAGNLSTSQLVVTVAHGTATQSGRTPLLGAIYSEFASALEYPCPFTPDHSMKVVVRSSVHEVQLQYAD